MKLSLFSISYAGLWGQHTLDLHEFIAKAAELGYQAVMIAGKRPHLSPLDASEATLESLRASLRRHNIECAAIAGYTDFSTAAAAEVPYIELQISYIDSLCRIAEALGASFVRVFTAYGHPQQSPQATWNGVVTALKEVCDRAKERHVTIAVQNHHDLGLHSDALLEMLHDIDRPNCKLGFDAWSPALRGEDVYQSALKMAPHTVMTTNADYIRLPRYRYQPHLVNYERSMPDMVRAVKFGEGFIDYPAFFQGLRDGGFGGLANYEMCSPLRGGGDLKNLDAYASQYVAFMDACNTA